MANQFTINSTHQFFSDKQKTLYDTLENAEKTANKNHNHERTEMEVDNTVNEKLNRKQGDHQEQRRERRECVHPSLEFKRDARFRQYKSRESIFKRPEAPIGRCLPHGRIPGFKKNPKQWTKYTLEDVKDEDMSDRSNTAVAFDFLRNLEKSKTQDNEEVLDELPKKILFKKSSILKKRQQSATGKVPEDDEKGTFKSSKVVMPEYVVGQVVKKDKKRSRVYDKNSAECSKVQLKLSHLDDNEDEDNL